MTTRIELPDRDILVCVLDDGATIVVDIEIIWRAKDGDDRGKLFGWRFAVHHVSGAWMTCEGDKESDRNAPCILSLVPSHDPK